MIAHFLTHLHGEANFPSDPSPTSRSRKQAEKSSRINNIVVGEISSKKMFIRWKNFHSEKLPRIMLMYLDKSPG